MRFIEHLFKCETEILFYYIVFDYKVNITNNKKIYKY